MTDAPSIDPALKLGSRAHLPDDLLALLRKYPREVWPEHENLGELAKFWLGRHDMFRELCAILAKSAEDLREGRIDPAEFRGFFAPRMRFFLHQLNGHHQIEDHAYFPAFMAAEASLTRGFEILENDHEIIHRDLVRMGEAGQALVESLSRDRDAQMRSAETMSGELTGFLTGLHRHLADEEDIIVPLILDRTEEKLGVK
ncbi:hemerythrin domain-containing protein [Afifella sp. JA880]|uniref:hemerythrin domain-containing protein n=1 Tax=Afifella sp. JA880 TaxID=2975280 RepID=UPI0021BAFB2F|nr:hemerythrin domain-containing protein [Afifella sp. JA880]MCT8268878.1 hemerythrin domain-containing protein [Afifella sp. JA880]